MNIKNYIIQRDLVIKIYTVGYEPCGESILFTINDGDEVLYSGLVDCFKSDDKNLILDLINILKIKQLNYLCVTHPDYDHCYGILDLKDKIGKNTTLALPQNIFNYSHYYDGRVEKEIDYLKELYCLRSDSSRKPKLLSCSDSKILVDDVLFTDSYMNHFPLSINSITPSSAILERNAIKIDNGSMRIDSQINNDFSIVNLISIGKLKLMLCSDVQDKTIEYLIKHRSYADSKFLDNFIDYLKIPHHASSGSLRLFELISNTRIGNSVTTVFRSSGLPDTKVLGKYMNISKRVYSTGKIDNYDEKYGIVTFTFNISKETMSNELHYGAVCLK